MKLLFEFLPIVVFFGVYWAYDIFIATAATIVCMVLQMIWLVVRREPVSTIQKISFLLVLIFGAATLALQDQTFIKLKPTVFYWLVAIGFAASAMFFQKNIVKVLLGSQIELPEFAWGRLNVGWIAFFLLLGAANLLVARLFSDDVWVYFKLSTIGLTVLFFVAQGVYISRHLEKAP